MLMSGSGFKEEDYGKWKLDPKAVTLRRQGYGEKKEQALFKAEIYKKTGEQKKNKEHEIP